MHYLVTKKNTGKKQQFVLFQQINTADIINSIFNIKLASDGVNKMETGDWAFQFLHMYIHPNVKKCEQSDHLTL